MSGNKNTQETSNNKNINVDKMDATDQCCNSKVVNSAFCVKKNDESVCEQTRYRLKITKTSGGRT